MAPNVYAEGYIDDVKTWTSVLTVAVVLLAGCGGGNDNSGGGGTNTGGGNTNTRGANAAGKQNFVANRKTRPTPQDAGATRPGRAKPGPLPPRPGPPPQAGHPSRRAMPPVQG